MPSFQHNMISQQEFCKKNDQCYDFDEFDTECKGIETSKFHVESCQAKQTMIPLIKGPKNEVVIVII